MAPPTLLTIAGHDPSSGAGITADLQTFASHRFFGTSAITALTVQSTLGVADLHAVPADLLARTLDYLAADLPPKGIKIGMTGSTKTIEIVANFLKKNANESIVYDPVLRSSSGKDLLPTDAIQTCHQHLLPAVQWITPNWHELSLLSAQPVSNLRDAEAAANLLAARHPHLHIVATGGDQASPTDILRLPNGQVHQLLGEHIETTSTHGTGCAFSSSLLCHLVQGVSPVQAVIAAKAYVAQALRTAPGIGHGRGPLNLLWTLNQSESNFDPTTAVIRL